MQNASIIIDNTDADIWSTSRNSANFDLTRIEVTEGGSDLKLRMTADVRIAN